MPLSPAQPRRLLHTRQTRYEGFERDDGLFDIEASLLDTKTFAFEVAGERTWEAGEAVHRMFIRLTVDLQLTVQDMGLPPAAMGGCLAWDPRGAMVARIYPQFHIGSPVSKDQA